MNGPRIFIYYRRNSVENGSFRVGFTCSTEPLRPFVLNIFDTCHLFSAQYLFLPVFWFLRRCLLFLTKGFPSCFTALRLPLFSVTIPRHRLQPFLHVRNLLLSLREFLVERKVLQTQGVFISNARNGRWYDSWGRRCDGRKFEVSIEKIAMVRPTILSQQVVFLSQVLDVSWMKHTCYCKDQLAK